MFNKKEFAKQFFFFKTEPYTTIFKLFYWGIVLSKQCYTLSTVFSSASRLIFGKSLMNIDIGIRLPSAPGIYLKGLHTHPTLRDPTLYQSVHSSVH